MTGLEALEGVRRMSEAVEVMPCALEALEVVRCVLWVPQRALCAAFCMLEPWRAYAMCWSCCRLCAMYYRRWGCALCAGVSDRRAAYAIGTGSDALCAGGCALYVACVTALMVQSPHLVGKCATQRCLSTN